MRLGGLAILLSVLALWWLTLDLGAGGVTLGPAPDAGTAADTGSIDAAASDDISQRSCGLAEIRMSKNGRGVDAKLEPIQSKLKEPPFSAFDSFMQVSAALPGEPLALSSGTKFQFLLSEVSDHRLTIKMQAEDADAKAILDFTIKMDMGKSFLIGMNNKADLATVVWLNCTGRE